MLLNLKSKPSVLNLCSTIIQCLSKIKNKRLNIRETFFNKHNCRFIVWLNGSWEVSTHCSIISWSDSLLNEWTDDDLTSVNQFLIIITLHAYCIKSSLPIQLKWLYSAGCINKNQLFLFTVSAISWNYSKHGESSNVLLEHEIYLNSFIRFWWK